MKNRIVAFDAFRFILALCVMFGHAFINLYREHEDIVNIQNLAVDGFFILSGFLLAMSYKKHEKNIEDPATSFIHFNWHRIKRLAPEFFFALVLTELFYVKVFPASTIFFNSLFISQINKIPGIVNGSWYISVLFWVGCIYSALLFYRKKTAVYIFIPLITFLCFSYMYGSYGSLSLNANPLIWDLFSSGFLKGFVGMGVGISLFFICQKMKTSSCHFRYPKLSFFILDVISFATLIYCFCLNLREKDIYLIYFSYPIILTLLYFHKETILKFLSWKIWELLTPSAMMLFLTHNLLLVFTKKYLPYKNYPQLTVYILVMVACVVFALICYHTQKWLWAKLKKFLFVFKNSEEEQKESNAT